MGVNLRKYDYVTFPVIRGPELVLVTVVCVARFYLCSFRLSGHVLGVSKGLFKLLGMIHENSDGTSRVGPSQLQLLVSRGPFLSI